VPVVTDKGAIPEVVGDSGQYVAYGDPAATAEAIKRAMESQNGGAARQRIRTIFSFEKRRETLLKAVNGLL
jgi:glycosyltransferase involved in cell wall biosynthesis